jgi:hypothetical protein
MKNINYLYSSLQKLSDEAKDKAVSFRYFAINSSSDIASADISMIKFMV